MGLERANTMVAQLPTKTISLTPSAMQQAAAVGNAITQSQGLSNLSNGQVIQAFPMPTSLSVTITSAAGAGALSTTTRVFNSFLQAAATDNGSGAGSITTEYGDGHNGVVYEQLAKSAAMGQGVKVLGFTIVAQNATSGAQVNSFNTANLALMVANGMGQDIPFPVKLQEAIRNTQYQPGTLTPVAPFMLNSLMQLQLTIPANTQYQFTFFTDASSFNG